MNLKLILSLAFVLSMNFSVQAQDKTEAVSNAKPSPANNKLEEKYTAQDYEVLLGKLNGGDTNIDFTTLRMAFTKTKNYSYHGAEKSEQGKFLQPFNNKNYREALKQAEKFLADNFVDANAHFVAHSAAKELKDDKKADFHKAVLLGLLNSIKNGNDGLSAEKPFQVITIDEEYAMMRFLGYKFSSQSLQNANGHQFDVFTATNTKTNEEVKLYFNIDVVWKAETEIFGK